jgi:hypothetical protein
MKDELEPFKLYIEKAQELLDSSFAKEMAKPTGVGISWKQGNQLISHRGPSQESIKSYILTLRLFIQGNERISFKSMEKNFQRLTYNKELYNKFKDIKEALNKYLDSSSMFKINEEISHRQLMDTFIYGDLSHTNPEKRKLYQSWMSHDIMGELMKNEFKQIIGKVLIAISIVNSLCKEILEKHNTNYK